MVQQKRSNRLRVVRAERAISQMDLAIEAGLTRDCVWRIEKGYKLPTPAEVAKLASALKVDREALGFSEMAATA